MDPSSLAAAISNLKSAETATKIQYAVAAKALDVTGQQGSAMVELIQQASQGFEESLARANQGTDPTRLLDYYA